MPVTEQRRDDLALACLALGITGAPVRGQLRQGDHGKGIFRGARRELRLVPVRQPVHAEAEPQPRAVTLAAVLAQLLRLVVRDTADLPAAARELATDARAEPDPLPLLDLIETILVYK